MRTERPSPHKVALALLAQVLIARRSDDTSGADAATKVRLEAALARPGVLQKLSVFLVSEIGRVEHIVEPPLAVLCASLVSHLGGGSGGGSGSGSGSGGGGGGGGAAESLVQYVQTRMAMAVQSPNHLVDLFDTLKVRTLPMPMRMRTRWK